MSFFHRKKIDEHTSMVPLGRDRFTYREYDHEMNITAELGSNPTRLVYASSVREWLPPHDGEKVTEAKRREILRKVGQYFDNNGISYKIVK